MNPNMTPLPSGYTHVRHTFEPVFDERSRILILGSFPSVKSRENQFYYGHPQNRFWPVLAALTGEPVPAREDIEAKKQIIISSDKPPKEIATLEGRLKSRFEWGLIADISSPDYETRMAILRKKEERDSKEKGYHLDDEVIQYIATNIKSNIRELEGALNRITAMSSLEHREITVELAQEALKDMISPNAKREITPDLILLTVAEHFHIKTDDIKGSKRSADIVIPRQIAMYLCREMTSTPLKAIGKLMGNRDHTTVLHGVEKISKEIETSDDLKNTIDIIKKKLNPN